MKAYKVISVIDGIPTFEKGVEDIAKECVIGGGLQILTPDDFLSYQQIKWWKGVLLPAFSKSTGDTKDTCETRLKLAVMPDKFQPKVVFIQNEPFLMIPSITILSTKQMGELMEGSVGKLHDWEEMWATLPDKELRKK